MAMKEGIGLYAPEPIVVKMEHGFLKAIKVEAVKLNHYRNPGGKWRKGLIERSVTNISYLQDLTTQEKPIFVGKLGEFAIRDAACSKFGNVFDPVDFDYHEYGDDGIDLWFGSYSVQVKASCTTSKNLVRKTDEWGNKLELKGHIHAFLFWHGGMDVTYRGWIRTKDIPRYSTIGDCKAGGLNYVVPSNRLEEPSDLWNYLESEITSGIAA